MGDIADMMAEGILCAECGVFINDEEEGYAGACDYPRYCRDCGGDPNMNGQRPVKRNQKSLNKRRRKS